MDARDTDAMSAGRMQIGEAAERVGLSIRTIRHYEDAGLVVPSARSEEGFGSTPNRTSTVCASSSE